jgi:hypothetical protein
MQRRDLLKSAALRATFVPTCSTGQLFEKQEFHPPPSTGDRLVGYASESGPSLATRAGKEGLERHVENISSLPFVEARGRMNQGCAIRWSWR